MKSSLIAGGRFAARLLRVLDADTEVNRFPIGGGFSAFPGTQFLIGAKAGYRVGPFGIFAKVRPGFIRFDQPPFPRTPELGTRPVVDLGGVFEIYSKYHVFVRIDYGDIVVSYGNSGFGTRHQLQAGFGVGVWF